MGGALGMLFTNLCLVQPLSKRCGLKILLTMSCACGLAAYIGTVCAPSAKALYLTSFIGSLGSAAIPGYFAIQMKLTPERNRAEVTGVFQAAGAIAGVLGPLFFNLDFVKFLDSESVVLNPFV